MAAMSTERRHKALAWGGLAVALLMVAAAALTLWLLGFGPLRLVERQPAAGTQAPLTAPLRLVWSSPVEAEEIEGRLHLEPAVDGRLVVDGRQVLFWPRAAWSPGTTYTVTVEAGVSGARGQPSRRQERWQFHVRPPGLLYLGRTAPGDGPRQLFLADPGGDSARQLTAQPLGLWDYAVHPLGQAVIYAAVRDDGGSDLWIVQADGTGDRLLLACPGEACLNPAWSFTAGGEAGVVAYERRPLWASAPNLDPQAGRLWLLEVDGAKTWPLFDYEVALHSPTWAPPLRPEGAADGGERLAYASPTLPGVEVYDLATEELFQVGNEWGAAPAWSPDGGRLALSELLLAGESLVVHLFRVEVGSGELLDLSGEDSLVQDVGPAWSPAGGWIAVGRQWLDGERWTPGRQIWLIRPDGSGAYPLLEEPMAHHLALAWRPDAAALAYARSDLSEGSLPVPDVSVWVYDLVARRPILVAEQAVLPRWLP
jgi:Tol biopolymer transport system component